MLSFKQRPQSKGAKAAEKIAKAMPRSLSVPSYCEPGNMPFSTPSRPSTMSLGKGVKKT